VAAPILRQFGDLVAEDFATHPIWIGCHTADYDEQWYDETDEETFRPRVGPLPADPSEGMLLVRATATLHDGTLLPGFLTPSIEDGDLGTIQPHVFAGNEIFHFWGGSVGVPAEERSEFLRVVDKAENEIFPMRVEADAGLSGGLVHAELTGWLETC
jgi:hypothetical protein